MLYWLYFYLMGITGCQTLTASEFGYKLLAQHQVRSTSEVKESLLVLITPSSISYICSGCNVVDVLPHNSKEVSHPFTSHHASVSKQPARNIHNEMLMKWLPSHGSSYSLCVLHRFFPCEAFSSFIFTQTEELVGTSWFSLDSLSAVFTAAENAHCATCLLAKYHLKQH